MLLFSRGLEGFSLTSRQFQRCVLYSRKSSCISPIVNYHIYRGPLVFRTKMSMPPPNKVRSLDMYLIYSTCIRSSLYIIIHLKFKLYHFFHWSFPNNPMVHSCQTPAYPAFELTFLRTTTLIKDDVLTEVNSSHHNILPLSLPTTKPSHKRLNSNPAIPTTLS